MDMMMPLMDGATAITTLQKINSQVKVVAVSGLNVSEKLAKIPGVKKFIGKPYTTKELLQTLHSILVQKSTNPNLCIAPSKTLFK
jgi:CheY-like chemotaxis protein